MKLTKRIWNTLDDPFILWSYVISSFPMCYLAYNLNGLLGIIGKFFYLSFIIIVYSKVAHKYIVKKS